MTDETAFPRFRAALLDWFALNRRPLPWRAQYTPYATWIAEIMLQQTQMERGVAYFLRWMERFPDIHAVAAAPEDALLAAWEGLGYYRRARNIQAAARAVLERHNGVFPERYADILALPGIGPYTAGAIASTAFNAPVPCVDGNVERVLSRAFNIDTPVRAEPAKSRLRALAETLIPAGRARDFNQALMELGALVCRKAPRCADCPLAGQCESRRLGLEGQRPVSAPKKASVRVVVANGILRHAGKVFIQRRQDEGVWAGLWEFPGGGVEAGETPAQAVVREWREELGLTVTAGEELAVIRHTYTIYRVTLHAFALQLAAPATPFPPALTEATDWAWATPDELSRYPMPAPHRLLAGKLK